MKCIQCNSRDLIKDVRVVDHGRENSKRNLTIETHKNPTGWIFKGAIEVEVFSHVCGACGFVMLYTNVAHAQELRKGESPKQ